MDRDVLTSVDVRPWRFQKPLGPEDLSVEQWVALSNTILKQLSLTSHASILLYWPLQRLTCISNCRQPPGWLPMS